MLKEVLKYESKLDVRATEIAIKETKDMFERRLANNLNLTRVSAPLFVQAHTGLNDNLNGSERPVKFDVKALGNEEVEIVHSLAKWKRVALSRYGFECGEGLYTDMNAIRRDEDFSNLHSIYVDQWDWEKIISKEIRNFDYLKGTVKSIFKTFKETEAHLVATFPTIEAFLPEEIKFFTSEELLQMYPDLTSKEREDAVCKEYKAVFITKIGDKLSNGEKHDGRAPDYDDWSLNGDILFWYPVLEQAFEVSSMGIRVDREAMLEQLKKADAEDRLDMPFHQDIVNEKLPLTMGGGIGQSRICMYLLNKAHIGEVQASIWSEEMIQECEKQGIFLL